MAVNLQKGQKVDLTKGNAGLKNIMVGLGWDESGASGGKKSFFEKLKATPAIDCDASVFVCDANGKLSGTKDVVYFGNLRHSSGSIMHQGDNLTGAGDGDDEQILINLANVPSNFEKLVFVVNIYDCKKRNQDFGMIENAFIRLVDADKNEELYRYNLSENYQGMTAMIFGEIYRYKGEWKFTATGQGTNDAGLNELAKRYA